MNREVNLTKRAQTPHGWRYCRVVLSANGRIKPGLVIVSGEQEAHKEGANYLEWREGSKRIRLSVGKNPADASARRQRKEAELNAVNNGVAVADFLDEPEFTKKPKTLAPYSTGLAYFVESCHKLNLDEINREDLLKFSAFLRDEKDQVPRSVYNKLENVMTFLKANGIRGLAGKNDWPGSPKKSWRSTSRKNSISCSQSVTRKSGSGMSSS
jgi:integrase/recombinase XerD